MRGLVEPRPRVADAASFAGAALIAVSAAWAFVPLVQWLDPALRSLTGTPMLLGRADLALPEVIRRLALPALLIGIAVWVQHERLPRPVRTALLMLVGVLGMVSSHPLASPCLCGAV